MIIADIIKIERMRRCMEKREASEKVVYNFTHPPEKEKNEVELYRARDN